MVIYIEYQNIRIVSTPGFYNRYKLAKITLDKLGILWYRIDTKTEQKQQEKNDEIHSDAHDGND